MKKIISLLSVGLVSVVAQAGYLLWTVDGADISAFEDEQSVTVAYARFGRVLGDGSSLYVKGENLTVLDTWNEPFGENGVSCDSSGLDDHAFKVDASTMGGDSYSYYIELLNSSGQVLGRTVSDGKYIQYSALSDHISTGDLGDVPPVAGVWHGGGFEAVPEPSSMALLALGAGLVGLRRKLRKGKKGKRA